MGATTPSNIEHLRCAAQILTQKTSFTVVILALGNDSAPAQAVYNATAYGSNITVAWQSYNIEGDSVVKGPPCSLFNTTQQSIVSFFNNTGVIIPRIVSYLNEKLTIRSRSTDTREDSRDLAPLREDSHQEEES